MLGAALRNRSFVTRALSGLLHGAMRTMRPMDARAVQRVNWLVLAIIVAGSLRLNLLVQTLPYGRANSVQTAETALSSFLAKVDYPTLLLFARFRDQVLAQLPAHSCLTYRGKKIIICGSHPLPQTQPAGEEEAADAIHWPGEGFYQGQARAATGDYLPGLSGYLGWTAVERASGITPGAKVELQCPPQVCQPQSLKEAGIWQALAAVGWQAILVADRGFGHKALLTKLFLRQVDFIIRMEVCHAQPFKQGLR